MSPTELRHLSHVLVAHGQRARAVAEAARLRGVKPRTKTETARASADAHQANADAATDRNAKRKHSGGGRPSFPPLVGRRSQAVGHRFILRRQLQQRLDDGVVAHQRRHALEVRGLPAQFSFVHSRRTIPTGTGGGEMPASWNAGEYRNRATAWLQKAETLPAGRERDACVVLAEGYLNLAKLLEAQQGTPIGDEAAPPSS
jgi:hypothetical protein